MLFFFVFFALTWQEQKFLIGVILMVPCYAIESVSLWEVIFYINLKDEWNLHSIVSWWIEPVGGCVWVVFFKDKLINILQKIYSQEWIKWYILSFSLSSSASISLVFLHASHLLSSLSPHSNIYILQSNDIFPEKSLLWPISYYQIYHELISLLFSKSFEFAKASLELTILASTVAKKETRRHAS